MPSRRSRSICGSGLRKACSRSASIVIALLGAIYFVRAKYSVLLLYLILVMGIQGMVMTRDLFNLFVFLEIVSIGTYGLLSLQDTPQALSAAFKFILATVLASSFFLLGTALVYYTTGKLNIDDLVGGERRSVGAVRLRRADAAAGLSADRTEAVSGQWLGARCLRDRAARGRGFGFGRRLGRRVLCSAETVADVRANNCRSSPCRGRSPSFFRT